ncbi:PAS domain-containing sensor histidine kinase [Paenibacillus eucommiae]|uniref:histidine kinase n=1 Tax=Paenibacillus eucommiae TaxID=1355755 RepID=A0ABS4INP3_9BACL|nr:PAS domain-containing sensor histidine kinase [Paenibacillus eucommiae]MBP1989164.1 PAS domain S-box-containing protein [Paenibacillus eucommiae]
MDPNQINKTGNELIFRSFFLQNPDAVCFFDLKGKLTHANPAAERLLGCTSEELSAIDLYSLLVVADKQDYEISICNMLGFVTELQVQHIAIDADAEGNAVGSFIIAKDITAQKNTEKPAIIQEQGERKKLEQSLIEIYQRYESFITYNPDGVRAIDLNGNFTEVNPAYEQITGYSKEELLTIAMKDLTFEDDREQLSKEWIMINETQASHSFDTGIRHKQGHRVEVRIHNIPIYINGQLVEIFGTVKDITDLQRTEELLRKSDKLSAVGQLAAAVAHEIRNPLTSLKGFIQLLKHTYPEAKSHYIEIMLSELSRIELISSELLVLAKPQMTVFQQKDVCFIMSDVISLLESQANINSVQIIAAFDEGIPLLHCEENQLKQVFINIIKNGIEAMSSGGIIRVSIKKDQQHVRIQVFDEGCGIPENFVSKIGEPFYSTKEKGTGLGLMVTQRIIEAHKGRLDIKSKVNKGTTVSVILPLT